MMMKILRYPLFILSLLTLILLGCKKDKPVEISDFTLPTASYYVAEGDQIHIGINLGNKKYTLTVEDQAVLEATSAPDLGITGVIKVLGLKKGTTIVHIKDEIIGKEIPVTVHVVDLFILLRAGGQVPSIKGDPLVSTASIKVIREEVVKFNVFDREDLILLQRHEGGKFFVFANKDNLKNGVLKTSGTYTFTLNELDEQIIQFQFAGENAPISLSLQLNSAFANKVMSNFASDDASFKPLNMPIIRMEGNRNFEYFDEYFSLVQDHTAYFIGEQYKGIEWVKLFEQVHLWHDYYNYGLEIKPGILQ